jgi:membrane-bound lytic murein transglycosylase MltF
MRKFVHCLPILAIVTLAAASCSQHKGTAPGGAQSEAAAAGGAAPGAGAPAERPLEALPEELRRLADRTFTGDLDAMVKRRIIRAGVPFNRTFYFIDKGQPRGLSYEYLMMFEDKVNQQFKTGNARVHVLLLPMSHDALLPALAAGKLDVVVAQLTDTPERRKLVDFSNPTRKNVNEVVVTGPGSPAIASLDDLSGKRVFVRKSSSYYASLQALNEKFKAEHKPPVKVDAAPESLEDDDLLEMINAGLVPAIVVDDYLAQYWKQVFPHLDIHENIKLRSDGNLAVAFRKNSPQFSQEVNGFLADNSLNSVTGRVISRKYLQNTQYVTDAASQDERNKFLEMVNLFRKYGDSYKFDYLLMAAQGYQESRLNQNAKSHVGAIGVMQLVPATGAEQKVGDIRQIDPNIHAGVKYMRYIRDRYFEKEPMTDLDKGLFTFAAYNAGAGRIRQLRQEAAARGLNPNVWFGNVERIASERIGRETVTYVANIYKYYIAYRLIMAEQQRRNADKAALAKQVKQAN